MFPWITVKHVLDTTSGAEGERVTRPADTPPWHFFILNNWVYLYKIIHIIHIIDIIHIFIYIYSWCLLAVVVLPTQRCEKKVGLWKQTLAQLLIEAKTEPWSHTAPVVFSYWELVKSSISALLQSLCISALMKNKNKWAPMVWAKYVLPLKYQLRCLHINFSTRVKWEDLSSRNTICHTWSFIAIPHINNWK